jgi:hypothetical protein
MKYFILLLYCFVQVAFSQFSTELTTNSRQINGLIIDPEGEPSLGITVQVIGTSCFTTTDFDGKFCLVIPNGRKVYLSISCCYEPMTYLIEVDQNEIKIDLSSKRQWRKSKRLDKKLVRNNKLQTGFKEFYQDNSTEKVCDCNRR